MKIIVFYTINLAVGSVPVEDERPALIVGVDIQMVGCCFVCLFVCSFVC